MQEKEPHEEKEIKEVERLKQEKATESIQGLRRNSNGRLKPSGKQYTTTRTQRSYIHATTNIEMTEAKRKASRTFAKVAVAWLSS